ncbi:MAG: TolC family protein [Firmicutes bacterium]|nr:TolC family protein [Bacillota bacterium]
MKYNFRNLILIFTLLIVGFTPVQASSLQELSFEQAVELMNENNLGLKIAEINLEIAEIDYQKAMASNLMSGSQQSKMQAEHSLERARNTYRTAKRNNYLEIFRAYTDVLSAERALEIRELERSIAEHDYTIVQEKVRIGDAGRLDDLQELNRLEAAKRAELAAEHTLAETTRQLKRLVGLTEDTALKLGLEFALPELDLTLEESIALGLENSFNLWDQKSSLELQERQLQTSKIDGSAPIDVKRAELNITISRLNLEQEQASIVESITSSYHSLTDNRARLTSAERDWEIAQETYAIYQQQEEAGLITEMQLLQHKISMLNSHNNWQDAKVAYLISFLQFHHLLGLDGKLQ